MKNIITILAISAAITACNNSANNNASATAAEGEQAATTIPTVAGINYKYAWEHFNLQGKVKKLTEYSYLQEEDDNGKPTKGEPYGKYPVKTYFFNSEGLLTQMNEYEESEEGTYVKSIYQYDDQNRLTLIKVTNYEGGNTVTESYEYSPEGYLTSSTYNNDNKTDGGEAFSYKTTYTTTPTPEGIKVEEKGENDTQYPINYYNKQNLLVKRVLYDAQEQKNIGEALYTYDTNNRCQKETYNGLGSMFVRAYCAKGTASCYYDKYGNLTKVTLKEMSEGGEDDCEFSEESDYTKEYTYDEQGNIIHALVSMGSDPLIRTYKIEYY